MPSQLIFIPCFCRYGPPSSGYNCLLTDFPVPEMDPQRHFTEDTSCELYHRGSYGHGCEIDRWPYSANPSAYPNFTPVNRKDWSSPAPTPPTITSTVFTVTSSVYPYDPYGRGRSTTPTIPYDYGNSYFNTRGRPYLPPEPSYPTGPRFRPQRPVLPASPTVPPRDRPQRPQIPWSGGGYDMTPTTRKMDKSELSALFHSTL